jgi:hypothetical protein
MAILRLLLTGEPYNDSLMHQIAAIAAQNNLSLTVLNAYGQPVLAEDIRLATLVPLQETATSAATITLKRMQHFTFRQFWELVGHDLTSMRIVLRLMATYKQQFKDASPDSLLVDDLDGLDLGTGDWNFMHGTMQISSITFLKNWTAAELLAFKGFGQKRLDRVRAKLQSIGLALYGEETDE